MNYLEILGQNWLVALEAVPELLIGLQYTALVTVCSFSISIVAGLLIALLRLSANTWIRNFSFLYIQVFRSLSVYVYILFIYFGVTAFMGIDLEPIGAAMIALSLLNSAYMAEIFRSSIQALDGGQREAALCLGMSRHSAFMTVILPQAFRLSLPALVNQLTVIVKDSSIVGIIGVADTTYRAAQIANTTYLQFEMFTVVGVIYICVVLALSQLSGYLECRLRIS